MDKINSNTRLAFLAGSIVGLVASLLVLFGSLWIQERRVLARSQDRIRRMEAARPASQGLPVPPLPFGYALSPADLQWSLREVNGKSAMLGTFSGKTLLLNFWATYCAPCVAEMPSLAVLARSLPKDQFAVLAISPEDESTVRSFLASHPVDLPIYVAPPAPSPFLQWSVLPTTYLFSPDGDLLFRLAGAGDWSKPSVRQSLTSLATHRASRGM